MSANGSRWSTPGNPIAERVNGITRRIIRCAFKVSNTLGTGFLEKVYENALAHELRKAGLEVQQQYPVRVVYDSVLVGDYVCDLLVEQIVLVELKTVKAIDDAHRAQCLNYVQATKLPLCLLLNFGTPRVGIARLAGDDGRGVQLGTERELGTEQQTNADDTTCDC